MMKVDQVPCFMDFNTLDEAEKERQKQHENRNENMGWCPLLRGPCVDNCVCFTPARIHEFKYASHSIIRVYAQSCGNAMFSGYRWNQ